ncbi:NAD(P)-binding protein [Suhomyces tanzawaensis NRRL Y-17324]|uniref:NAD(P)-binding protein n=1 Tax=Suhomyces tanzawaensis NRRL Y-17324 TaxID=984487 RepID=A0A1E4SF86_9ASCO|nr:NAD(P)-binding protein [Suhomyces tanzawaensis NRRL Y-17324]ODV78194.1 NAD(P)-binding protein [Suhomyces tanzawaensis NRRL Y-17324]
MELIGHKALVTGASRGLGKAISHELASRGCSVVLLARNKHALRENLLQLPCNSPHQVHLYIDYDLLDVLQEPLDPRISEELKGVSALVNCAGISNYVLLPRLMNKYIESTIALNLIAPIVLSKHAYMPMLKSASRISKAPSGTLKRPVILNISSVLSLTDKTLAGTSVYAASKAGLLGFTTSLANELKGKVRVNALLPGLVPGTDMGASAHLDGELGAVTIEDVVKEVARIICDDTVNGECVILDGGNSKFIEATIKE